MDGIVVFDSALAQILAIARGGQGSSAVRALIEERSSGMGWLAALLRKSYEGR